MAAAGQLGTGSRGRRVELRLPPDLTSPCPGPRTCANTSPAGPPRTVLSAAPGSLSPAHPDPKARSTLGQGPCSLNCGSPGATFAGRTGSLGLVSRILPVLGPMKLRSEVVRLAGPLGRRWMPGACTCCLSPCFQLWEEGGTGDPVPAGVLGKQPCPLGPRRPACGAHRTA